MIKKILLPSFFLILLIISSFANIVNASSADNNSSTDINYYGKGYRYNIQGWVYIHIEGEPYERGYQYGYLASDEIVDTIHRWSNFAPSIDFMKTYIIKYKEYKAGNPEDLAKQWWKICRRSANNIFLKEVPEEYVQEMRGMADGVRDRGKKVHGRDIDFEDIVAVHFVQESKFNIKFAKLRYHPFRGIFSIHKVLKLLRGNIDYLLSSSQSIKSQHLGHCSAFIATGEATNDGGIVVAHSTFFDPLIAERCNIVLDVKPTKGYRFLMACVPGSMWSQEDFYFNEKGIVLTETELPQGPWKRGGTPKGVRSRRAIQYSDSIDEVVASLQDGNNGLIPNEWLIGDTKTGEIASMEQALFNTPIKRTFDGFYYSFTLPNDKKVQREIFGIISFIPSLSKKFYDRRAQGRDKKFEEVKEQYYGKIDEEIAKKILAIDPICKDMTDGKITSSNLIQDLGMMVFIGNPNGISWKPSEKIQKKYPGVTDLPAVGWAELFASNSEPNKLNKITNNYNPKKTSKLIWNFEINDTTNLDDSNNVYSEDIIYTTGYEGSVYALDANNGNLIWTQELDNEILNHEVSKDLVIIGTNTGVYGLNKVIGNVNWHKEIGETSSKPVIIDNTIITSLSNGDLSAIDLNSGNSKWELELPQSGEISNVFKNKICLGAGNTVYCINIINNEILWEYETSGKITASPRIDKNSVYVGSWDGNVYSLDLSNGELKWTFNSGWGIDTTPCVSNGMVFVGSNDNNFYALDEKSGDLVWYFTCKSGIHSSPDVYGDYVFFGSDDGRLYALDKFNGELGWNFTPGFSINDGDVNNYITTPIISDVVVEDSMVYISAKGNIYALDAQTSEIYKDVSKKSDDGLYFILFAILILVGIALILSRFIINKIKI